MVSTSSKLAILAAILLTDVEYSSAEGSSTQLRRSKKLKRKIDREIQKTEEILYDILHPEPAENDGETYEETAYPRKNAHKRKLKKDKKTKKGGKDEDKDEDEDKNGGDKDADKNADAAKQAATTTKTTPKLTTTTTTTTTTKTPKAAAQTAYSGATQEGKEETKQEEKATTAAPAKVETTKAQELTGPVKYDNGNNGKSSCSKEGWMNGFYKQMGYQAMGCDRGGAANQEITLPAPDGMQWPKWFWGNCETMHPCLCGLDEVKFAIYCPCQCRPYCGGKCASELQCDGYYARQPNGDIVHGFDYSKLKKDWNFWPPNLGEPRCM